MVLRMSAAEHRQDWEDVSRLDPYWAILAAPSRRFGRWERQEFLETGEEAIGALLREAARFGLPLARTEALDFGCGVGRLTRALAGRFERCLGLDISAPMIDEARSLNADVVNCRFVVHDRPDLAGVGTGSVDLVVSYLVLQHVVSADAKTRYIEEFVRVLRPGGLLVFQLPTWIPAPRRMQHKQRLYRFLRRSGIPPAQLYHRLHLHPMRMSSLPREHVAATIEASGGRVLDVHEHRSLGGVRSAEYLVTKNGATIRHPQRGPVR
jgi:SAM-dependent methyltransferase